MGYNAINDILDVVVYVIAPDVVSVSVVSFNNISGDNIKIVAVAGSYRSFASF